MQAKNIVIAIIVLVLIGAIGFLYFSKSSETTIVVKESPTTNDDVLPVEPDGGIGDTKENEPEAPVSETRDREEVLGESIDGRSIVAYHFGEGQKEILLVGGVHGGYSPNTTALAEEFVEYFKNNAGAIPDDLSITVIPNLNPDGTTKSGTDGRFNARGVDLNRNFDCDWSATALWQNKTVSGGTAAFSEPEATALRDYIDQYDPVAAVVWFGAEGKVYPSACGGVPSKASITLAANFATAAGYPSAAEFNAYNITGDMVNWMAKQGIPAISVLLSDYKNTEWTKNLAGVEAVLKSYSE